MDIISLSNETQFKNWLNEHSQTDHEIGISIYKKSTGRQTVSYEDLVRVAISFGWIDVLTKKVSEDRYAIKFVPRKPGGHWTKTNLQIAQELIKDGLMTEQGLAAYKSSNLI